MVIDGRSPPQPKDLFLLKFHINNDPHYYGGTVNIHYGAPGIQCICIISEPPSIKRIHLHLGGKRGQDLSVLGSGGHLL
ncbi:hypothetical protein CEXT_448101 [Caerostris extrusa]|uniref:Uncharacterized protein n=1 Tax=Caerostris extrusa TaxID=172846 RepID=A0AAV4XUH7_CAEEX|nr:hypothetical protein CEXT_448101 [Caerostris extrusa]